MNKNYSVRPEVLGEDRAKLRTFSDLSSHLLFYRGIKNVEEAVEFISPKYEEGLNDPFLLNDMEKAVNRIIVAMKTGERVVVFSDYDADGIPGAVVFHDFLKKAGFTNFVNYIPHRSDEGFGLNKEAIEGFAKSGCKLLITVDCGIGDVEEISIAKSLGIDVIVTDHHLPKEILPEAFAIVNPKVSENYPDKMLCGSGVAFKVVCAILSKDRFGIKKGFEKWLLDMVGIATLSDMVPLIGENRVFGFYGLLVLRKSRRLGIQKLLRKLKINQKKVTEDDIGFMISPRINAASRMGKSEDAFKLLVTEDGNEANELVEHLEKINNERKGATAYIAKEVKKMIEAKYSPFFLNKIIVAGNPAWKPSLLGIVAGGLAETHSKPVFLWGREGSQEALKGSCRSYGSVDLSKMMTALSPGVLTEFGGHTLAGGFSVSYESVHLLEEELERAYEKVSVETQAEPKWIDKEIDVDNISLSVLRDIEKLAPFGVGNSKPIFIIRNAKISDIQFFGKEKNHLKLVLEKGKVGKIEAISFFTAEELVKKAELQKNISIVGHIERAFFGGNPVRIRIIDIIE